ncbi:uncharacterized protein LOC141648729 [Silene latifolia]|uniref:uncharacterized protein LOC141648729 n=1 Tax=Silene latifolia TaxID=37657 RepID=UPI003D7829FD
MVRAHGRPRGRAAQATRGPISDPMTEDGDDQVVVRTPVTVNSLINYALHNSRTINNSRSVITPINPRLPVSGTSSKNPVVTATTAAIPTPVLVLMAAAAAAIVAEPHVVNSDPVSNSNVVGPWNMGAHTLILKQWTPTFDQEMDSITIVPIWILFPNLVPLLWSSAALSRLASKIGKPLFADLTTICKAKLSFVRVMVEVNISNPLPTEVLFTTPYHDIISQKVTYEWMPYYCDCCRLNKNNKIKEKQKGIYIPVTKPVVTLTPAVVASECSELGPNPPGDEVQNEISELSKSSECFELGSSSVTISALPPSRSDKCSGHQMLGPNTPGSKEVDTGVKCIFQAKGDSYSNGIEVLLVAADMVVSSREGKEPLWTELLRISTFSSSWILSGDFNIVKNTSEKIGPHPPKLSEVMAFNTCLRDCQLDDLTSSNCEYSWTNKHHDGTRGWSGLDRALVNANWMQNFPSSNAVVMVHGISDHSPILVNVFEDKRVRKQFSFLDCWITNPNYSNYVKIGWASNYRGSLIYQFFRKLAAVRQQLTLLHKEDYSGLSQRVATVELNLKSCQQALSVSLTDTILQNNEAHLIQQSIVGQINNHHGTTVHGVDRVNSAFVDYYQDLLGTQHHILDLDQAFVAQGAYLCPADQAPLCSPVTAIEIKDAHFFIGNYKSHGYDWFSTGFYKSAWPVVGDDFTKDVQAFFQTGKLAKQANVTVLTLIPKKDVVTSVKDFRPIACYTILYKTISKILVTYHPKCAKIKLNHLIFVDDLTIFVRGDVPSVKAVAQTLDKFGSVSRLLANPDKTDIYFDGVHKDVKAMIKQTTSYFEGSFPFRYLGLPLYDSKLSMPMYNALLCKVQQAVNHWTNHLLSYAGRLQLLNSILLGLENYWCNILSFPKALMKLIDKFCRNYLWQSNVDKQKICMKSWKKCCCPWNEGGFNINEVLSWNNANLCKWIWRLLHPSDSLWTRWNDAYTVKQGTIWNTAIKATYSESWRSILHTRDLLLQVFGTALAAENALKACVSAKGQFMVHKAYDLLRPRYPKIRWANVVWHPIVLHKHSFIATLAGQKKLPTVDNLCRRGLYLTNWCVLCKQAMETHSHLFFECVFAGDLWRKVLDWMRVRGRTSNLRKELYWCSNRRHRKHWQAGWYYCCLSACIYTVWQERNTRIFSGKETDIPTLLKQLQFSVRIRILNRTTKDSKRVIAHLNSIYA